ncbi:MAG: hypothetical protein HQ509_02540 [Candidatus Marinimicrobia bacterium]|nr:hypothetical protein [Candidatus Neomarinimicrobiota bacterium]
MTEQSLYKGILDNSSGSPRIISNDGHAILQDVPIWDGYLKHWLGKPVNARFLPQKDYENDHPILIMWPDSKPIYRSFVEFYYNERLVKYPASFFGHNAVNINGKIFNFSHLYNENEIMRPDEYFYRPALGEFAPSPDTGMFEIKEDGTAYFDKFGRNFMRTIHGIRIFGLDTDKLSEYLNHQLEVIHSTPPNPEKPEKYPDFNFFMRSCATIIRDGFRSLGFKKISGILPHDLFVNIVSVFMNEPSLEAALFTMPQLNVPEALPSTMTPLLNPRNRIRNYRLKKR